jgi:hypothetical protein
MSLARLGFGHGRRDGARELLAEAYSRFTEGLGTADLKAAKARSMLSTGHPKTLDSGRQQTSTGRSCSRDHGAFTTFYGISRH